MNADWIEIEFKSLLEIKFKKNSSTHFSIMGRLRDITATKKSAIYSLTKNTDYSNRQIAKMHNVSECTVRRIKSRGLASDSPTRYGSSRNGRCGRKQKISNRTKSVLIREIKKNRRLTSTQLTSTLRQHGVEVSARTVRRRLNDAGYHSRIALKKPRLTQTMMKKRLDFAKTYRNFSIEDWQKVRNFIMITKYCHKHKQ